MFILVLVVLVVTTSVRYVEWCVYAYVELSFLADFLLHTFSQYRTGKNNNIVAPCFSMCNMEIHMQSTPAELAPGNPAPAPSDEKLLGMKVCYCTTRWALYTLAHPDPLRIRIFRVMQMRIFKSELTVVHSMHFHCSRCSILLDFELCCGNGFPGLGVCHMPYEKLKILKMDL